jgi:hypothetical protein
MSAALSVGEGGITAHDIRGYCAGVRTIPDPGFTGDDGSADHAVKAALDDVAGGAPLEVAVAALCGARVLVPVVAVPSDPSVPSDPAAPSDAAAPSDPAAPSDAAAPSETAGPSEGATRDAGLEDPVPGSGLGAKEGTDMAAVLMTGRDGRQALLAFSSLDSLLAWNPEGRPVPVATRQAAQAALSEGADALVVDVAGPVQVPIEGSALRRVADGRRLVRLDDGFGWTLTT